MANRPGNNPKRRIAPLGFLSEQARTHLMNCVHYVGSGHHKINPADYGLPRTNPRPTKSLCDLSRTILLAEARQLLLDGIQCGLFSKPRSDGYPKFLWGVSKQGEVFEAKTDTNGTGDYHGYPLEDEDVMHGHVKAIWNERCRKTGQ